MLSKLKYLPLLLLALLCVAAPPAHAQTTGNIIGTVQDEKGAAITGATVTARNVETNFSRTAQTDSEGRYRFVRVPVGQYEVTVEAPSFAKYVRTGITLLLNQDAVVDATVQPAGVQEVVNVVENAALLNTTNAEVATRFDTRRLSELPLSTNRNVYNVALSAAGVSQLGPNQVGFANGINFSANGGRIRSNNFMIDGQDNNDFGVAGAAVPLNNPDVIQEVRLVTNQFTAEFGRNGSAVFNAITKSGSNEFHGTAFWFHNNNNLNACSNLDKNAGFCNPNATIESRRKAPFRIENQAGGTIGGPIIKDRTFFFGSIQRWWDRQLGSGVTIVGVPTEAGRAILQAQAGNRPQVQALLKFLPAAQTPIDQTATFNIGAQQFTVPLGSLTGSTNFIFNDWQSMFRIDHRFNDNHTLNGRYLYQDADTIGTGQASPPGNTQNNLSRNQGVNLTLNSVLSPRLVNEGRIAYLRAASNTTSNNPDSETIPSIEVNQLGLQGFNAAASRTAIGLGVNLPQFSFRETWQFQDNLSYTRGEHSAKFGFDIRRNRLRQLFKPTTRGRLVYSTLNRLVNDVALVAAINKDLPGVPSVLYLDWHDFFFYGQDEWKIRPNFTLTYGLRYELPGQPIQDLVNYNVPVVQANNGDARFRLTPVPTRDKNNLQPRIGFNWNIRTREDGALGWLTGGDRLVLRGGYARTHDYVFTNIALNIWSSFPFVAAATFATEQITLPGETAASAGVVNAFTRLPNPSINPATFARTVVSDDFSAPVYDSFSLELQRELTNDLVFKVGYVGSKGSDLFQTIDGNPRQPGCTPTAANNCRVDPTQATIRLRANTASSIYHSLQTSLEKRLSRGFSAGVHYTWSSFIDDASEIFNPSPGEIAVAQDSFNIDADRGRSTFDRPHRFTANAVYELPWFRDQRGFVGHVLGGWQFNGTVSLQSGAPFTPLNGTDPTGALSGIDSLVGNAIRPNVLSTLPLSNMSVEELFALRGAISTANGNALFQTLRPGQRVGNAGRNILRADGINNLDLGIVKNTRITETQKLQLRADFFNATNTRDFGIPQATVTNAGFLNQWGTNGGNRRIIVGLRYVF
jgi:hypothetical protein